MQIYISKLNWLFHQKYFNLSNVNILLIIIFENIFFGKFVVPKMLLCWIFWVFMPNSFHWPQEARYMSHFTLMFLKINADVSAHALMKNLEIFLYEYDQKFDPIRCFRSILSGSAGFFISIFCQCQRWAYCAL